MRQKAGRRRRRSAGAGAGTSTARRLPSIGAWVRGSVPAKADSSGRPHLKGGVVTPGRGSCRRPPGGKRYLIERGRGRQHTGGRQQRLSFCRFWAERAVVPGAVLQGGKASLHQASASTARRAPPGGAGCRPRDVGLVRARTAGPLPLSNRQLSDIDTGCCQCPARAERPAPPFCSTLAGASRVEAQPRPLDPFH